MQLLLISFLIHLIIFIASAQLDIWAKECSDAYGNYTSNSTFKSNLDALLTNISTTDIPYGFYNFSVGQDSDQVNALALCRGDVVNVTECHACLNLMISNLTGSCPTQMEAIGWAEKCMLRYSTRSILGGVWTSRPLYNLATGVDASGDVDHFASVVEDLLMSLPNKTADGDSRLKFATGEANVSASQKVYGLMQCTPDLIASDCLGCLYWGMYYVLHSDRGQTGARVLSPSCSIRYELHKFYVAPPPQAATPSSYSRSGEGSGMSQNVITIIVVVAVIVCLFLFVIFLVWFCLRRRRNPGQIVELSNVKEAISFEPLQKDYSVIRDATNNFSKDNELGSGGFGKVYKGNLDGKEIAVKRLERSPRSSDKESSDKEFKNEVEIAAKIQHTNLAELIGFCLEGEERLLIFEFVSNGSLDKILFDEERRAELDWRKRLIIIEGIAQGLQYLHQYSRKKIIHRDLKPANVLLDEDWRPKITDFGTARLFPDDVTHAITKKAVGTWGYKAPEYANGGKYSTRSDVYSFGIMVLEIVAGRKNVLSRDSDQETWLISMAWRNWKNKRALDIVDPTTVSEDSASEMERCIHIGLLCVQDKEANRPEMSRVLHMLSGEYSLESPSRPPFIENSSDSHLPLEALFESRSSQSNASAGHLSHPR